MAIEYELKFKADPQTLDKIQATLALPGQTIAMETTYYDTPNGAFSARKWTLRRRLENSKSVCTFKFPADGIGRGEIEVEKDSLEAAIPELCKLSGNEELAILAQAGLVPVCGARFTRTAFFMSFGNAKLELALDRGVLLGGGRELPLYEVEAEWKAGEASDVDRFGAYLQAAFGIQPETRSKFVRARLLAKGEL